jgi:hypothetical protein
MDVAFVLSLAFIGRHPIRSIHQFQLFIVSSEEADCAN